MTVCFCLPDACCGSDLDDIFAFKTTKYARIRDAQLGILKYIFMLGIFLYIVVYSLWMENGYLQKLAPSGSIQFTLVAPGSPENDPDYDGKISEMFYCVGNTVPRAFKKYPCIWADGISAGYPQGQDFLLATRITRTEQTRQKCGDTCKAAWLPAINASDASLDNTAFIANPGAYVLQVDHSVQQSVLDLVGQSRDMTGKLRVGREGKQLTDDQVQLCMDDPTAVAKFSDEPAKGGKGKSTDRSFWRSNGCYLNTNLTDDGIDSFLVQTLLTAANVTLDGYSFGNHHSQRFNGLTVISNIKYENFKPWAGASGDAITYSYELYGLTAGSYNQNEIIYQFPDGSSQPTNTSQGLPQKRDVIQNHGVSFHFLQDGQLAAFEFSTLLTKLTSSLTLLAIATTVVNYLALYAMRNRKYYKECMYEYSEDFSSLHDSQLESYSLRELQRMCRELNILSGGSKEQLVVRLFKEQCAQAEEEKIEQTIGRGNSSSNSRHRPSNKAALLGPKV